MLLPDVYQRLVRNPEWLRQTILAAPTTKTVVIDEIQRIPELLNEIHWLIANTDAQCIMSGSSARKILRSGANLLGGRALRYELYPLIAQEIPDFNLLRALNHGLLPRHYLVEHPQKRIEAYLGNYLKDEIAQEAKIRNIQVFSRFLEAAAFSNGEIVNYTNIATECGVSATTVKEYFQILQNTLIARFVPVYQKKPKRRVITSPKFYFFDIGIVNNLLKRGNIQMGSEIFGNSFEHFIYLEIHAHAHYSGLEYPINYWRTASQLKVDFVLGDHELAIEVKSSSSISYKHLNGLKAFMEEYTVKHAIVVCNEPMPRLIENIMILPWQFFLQNLWAGKYLY